MKAFEIFLDKYQPLIADMKHCEHGAWGSKNPYHMEGNIFSHTLLVYNHCINNYSDMIPRDFYLLQIACLFHDSGKPYTWELNDEKKKKYFHGHWNMSFYKVLDMLKDNHFDLTDEEIILIADLVLMHHQRYQKKECSRSQTFVSFLNALTDCDVMGRILAKEEEPLEELVVGEHIYETDKPTIHFLIGIPCSGKSTYIKENNIKNILSRDSIVMELSSSDDYNASWVEVNHKDVDKLLEKRYRDFIRKGEDFYIDMTNLSKKRRKRFHHKDFNSKAIMFYVGYEEIMKRNSERVGKHIDQSIYTNMIKSFSMGFYDEFCEIERVVR